MAPIQRRASGAPPTMEDVARVAGVSHQTVSRVLNEHPNVSAATRDKVSAAIGELGYRRNAAARSLVTRSSRVIGVIITELEQYGPASTLLGLQEAAFRDGYFVSVAGLRELTPAAMAESVNHLLNQAPDGIVVVAPVQAGVDLFRDLELTIPLEVVAGGLAPEGSQEHAARSAVAHLADLGHRTIAHLAGPEQWIDAQRRASGWRAELQARGLDPAPPMTGDWGPESGYRCGLAFDAAAQSAVFVANDQMALGFMRALHERGISVPGDVSVIGFDDQPEAAYFLPPLTTVRQDFRRMGRYYIDQLLLQIAGTGTSAGDTALPADDGTVQVLPAPELVVRSSTAPRADRKHPGFPATGSLDPTTALSIIATRAELNCCAHIGNLVGNEYAVRTTNNGVLPVDGSPEISGIRSEIRGDDCLSLGGIVLGQKDARN
ncbi:LacI family DNA-binding transcriptional regulator [Arthrobacter sp. ATA002]|uniref:LacI family DNA-binding transcriptional regulator n=1 Tax=Arthrobacter sp. ATA002 TaxID=2991715 RepID=UPI0022A73612|nr:LacI family DNA-binding transcriptional regulator [Arthrobacter sp. ATA002]WAP50449.1 LacI family DNA-binding transcriptional regulator [Arthrobacter sp. ATA002]